MDAGGIPEGQHEKPVGVHVVPQVFDVAAHIAEVLTDGYYERAEGVSKTSSRFPNSMSSVLLPLT